MVRSILLPLLALGCLTHPAAGLSRQAVQHRHVHKHDARQEIAGLEQQWRTAILTTDVPLMDSLLSEDYVGISMTGQVNTKAMQLERLRNRTLRLTRLDLSDLKMKLVGPVAIVTSTAQIEGTNDGVNMSGTFRYTRVYQRASSGGWKITNFEATRLMTSHAREVTQPG